jgi:hypothetical protein
MRNLFKRIGAVRAVGASEPIWQMQMSIQDDVAPRSDREGSPGWYWRQVLMAVVVGSAAVARLHRSHAAPMLLAYLVSVFAALVASAAILSLLGPRAPVPHPLFYLVSVTLPYQWRSGFVLVPFIIVLGGLWGGRRVAARCE